MKKRVYADYNATAPCSEEHLRAVFSQIKKIYANPSSIHYLGRESKLLLEDSRAEISKHLGAPKKSILFCSGATEANNFILQGFVRDFFLKNKRKAKVVLSNAEHSSVYEVLRYLEKIGWCTLHFLPVNEKGFLDPETLEKDLPDEADFLTALHVNNETGAISPIFNLAESFRKKFPKAPIHVDLVQSFGKLDLTLLAESEIDTASASGHKIGGLKGAGFVYCKKEQSLSPLLLGGGQERGWRSGTENLPGIVSLALRIEALKRVNLLQHMEPLHRNFVDSLKTLPKLHINGDPEHSLPTTLNFYVEEIGGEELLLAFDIAGIAVSKGSACASGGGRPSRVLKAMGLSDENAKNSLRLSFGVETTQEDIDYILKVLGDIIRSKN